MPRTGFLFADKICKGIFVEIKDYGAAIACPYCGSKHHINLRRGRWRRGACYRVREMRDPPGERGLGRP